MKYKLYRKDFEKFKDWIAVLPYITIRINNPEWYVKNFQISFGWIVWHGRIFWLAKENEHDGE